MNTGKSPKLIVRAAMPSRQRLLWIGLVGAGLVGAYGIFEYGRSRGGHDSWIAAGDRRELNEKLAQLELENRKLREQVATVDTERVSLSRERAEVARTIGDLQAQVSRGAQQLAFYKGLVTQGGNTEDVKIQRIRVESGTIAGHFRLKIGLVRPVQTENLVQGVVRVQVDGLLKGQASRYQPKDQAYSFRYVENLDTELILPVDFRPERVTVEIRSAKKGIDPLVQTQVWDVDAT